MTLRQIVTRGSVLLALVLAGFAAFGFVWSGGSPPEPAEERTVLPVDTKAAEAVTSFLKRRTFTGVLKAARTSELGFERTGRLISVEVSEGNRVVQGQVLARLDTENLKAKQQELTAQRAAARSLLDELEAGPRKQTIAAARAEVNDLRSQVELANLNFHRRETLLASRAISREDYDQTALGLESARARLDAAQRRLDELEAGTRKERIAAQEAAVAQLDAALANIKVELDESILRAPFAGMIGKRHLDEGTIVAPGAALLRLVEDQRLEAWIGLPASLAAKLTVDERVTLAVGRHEHTATLKAVLPELDPATRTRSAIFQLDSDASAFPSQVVRIELEDWTETTGFWVPITALTRGSRGLWSVLIVDRPDGSEFDEANKARAGTALVAAKRDVEVLYTESQRALVRGTLQVGDQVIISGTHRIVNGQSISLPSDSQRPDQLAHVR